MKTLFPFTRRAIIVALIAFPAAAEELQTYQLPEIRVTAKGVANKANPDIWPVEQIKAGGDSLETLLGNAPGAELAQSGGAGQMASIFLRGTSSRHNVMLVDGVKLGSATTGQVNYAVLDPFLFDSIELAKGPLSALYGANAVGGVFYSDIRIAPGFRALAESGGHDYGRVAASYGFQGSSLSGGIKLSRSSRDGQSATSPSAGPFSYHPDDDGNERFSGVGKLAWQRGDTRIELSHLSSRLLADTDEGGPFTLDRNFQEVESTSLRLSARPAANWKTILTLGGSRDETETSGAFPAHVETRSTQFSWFNSLALPVGEVTAGYERELQRAMGGIAYDRDNRANHAWLAGYRLQQDSYHFSLNLRREQDGQFGGHTTGSAYLGHKVGSLTLYGLAGTAFRAPTFNDLYWPFALFFCCAGNPSLEPEKSRASELGFRHDDGRHEIKAAWFHNRITNLIVYDAITDTNQNLSSATIRGLDALWRFRAGNWRLGADLLLQDPKNSLTGKQLARRAKASGGVTMDYASGPWEAGTALRASGGRYDNETNTTAARMGGYGLLSAYAKYALNKNLKITARASNIQDKQYEQVKGFQPEGRLFTLGMELGL